MVLRLGRPGQPGWGETGEGRPGIPLPGSSVCPAEWREVLRGLSVEIYQGGGGEGGRRRHFQPKQVCEEKRKLPREPEDFGIAHCDTVLLTPAYPTVTIAPGRRSYYPQDQHREQISDLDLSGVRGQTGVETKAANPTLSGLLSVGTSEARNSSGWPS